MCKFGMSVEVSDSTKSHLRLDKLTNEILDLICHHAMRKRSPYPRREKNPLEGFSRTSKFFNAISAPHQFKVVSICSAWELRHAARVLVDCERFHKHTKRLKISVFPGERPTDEVVRYKKTKGLAADLWNVLGPVCWRLEELYLNIMLRHQGSAQSLRGALRRQKGKTERKPRDNTRVTLNMPKLRKLIVGNYCEFILDQCPNVKQISSHGTDFIRGFHQEDSICFGSSRLVERMSRLQHLKYIELDAAWDCFQICRLVEILAPIAHQIERLALHGSLSYGASKRPPDSDDDPDDETQNYDLEFYNIDADDAMEQVLHDGITSSYWGANIPSTVSDVVRCHMEDFGYSGWVRTRHLRAICRKALNAFCLPNLRVLTLPEITQLACQYRRPISADPPSWAALDLERVHATAWGPYDIIPHSPNEVLELEDDGTMWYPDEACIATMAMECADYLTDIIGLESDAESLCETEAELDVVTDTGTDTEKQPREDLGSNVGTEMGTTTASSLAVIPTKSPNTRRKDKDPSMIPLTDPWIHAEENFISIVETDVTGLAATVVADECSQVEQIWFGDHVQVTIIGVVMDNGRWTAVQDLADDHPKKHSRTTEAYTLGCMRETADGKRKLRKGVYMQKARNIHRW